MTFPAKDATGTTQNLEVPNANGRAAASASRPVVLATEDKTAVDLIATRTGSLETNTVYAGTTALTPKFVAVSASTSGNNTLIAAVASKKIRVLSYTLVCTSAVTAKFQSGAGGTDLTGAMPFGANGGVSVPFNPVGHFETAVNTLLNLSLGSGVQVSGHINYVEV